MTALIVVLIVLAVLVLPLLPRGSAVISYRGGEFALRGRYLLLSIDVLKLVERLLAPKTKKGKKAKKPGKKKVPEQEKKKRTGREIYVLVRTVLESSRTGVDIIRRHVVFSRVRARIRVGGADAHKTAVAYARTTQAAALALDLVGILFVLKESDVQIRPDFTAQETKTDISLRVGIRPIFFVVAGVHVFYRYLRLSPKKSNTSKERKGGNQHERAASHQ